jgi:hypothetical protein
VLQSQWALGNAALASRLRRLNHRKLSRIREPQVEQYKINLNLLAEQDKEPERKLDSLRLAEWGHLNGLRVCSVLVSAKQQLIYIVKSGGLGRLLNEESVRER